MSTTVSDITEHITALRRGVATISALVAGIGDEQAHWRPAPGKWSIVEIVSHLADEEREDFRTRLELTLRDPDAAWPPLDPEGVVTARNYQSRDLKSSLASFVAERSATLAWLESLDDIHLGRAHTHGSRGTFSAGDLLVSWVAHDLHHIRQLAAVQLAWVDERAGRFSTAYAR